jgi:hypothetical protein
MAASRTLARTRINRARRSSLPQSPRDGRGRDKHKRSIVKKATSFNLIAALALVSTLTAPAFAEDGKDAPSHATEMAETISPDRPLLTPFPRQWWKDN